MALTARQKAPYLLTDEPKQPAQGFIGYFHNTDPTVLPYNALTYPSINGFIPQKDKIVPRDGSTLLGQEHTNGKAWPIIGNKKRFTTMGGITTEVRVTQSDDTSLKDIIEVLYPNPVTNDLQWYQITENVNPFAKALGKLGMRARYYMADWLDTSTNPALSLNLPRLIMVNGSNTVFNWTGGISPIGTVTPTTIASFGPTWASLGFVSSALGGSGNIIINGIVYAITGGWNTNTLTLASTAGITEFVDVALSQIQVDTAPIQFDSCTQNKGYMYYGNWASHRYFQSNGFNRDALIEITQAQAIQNDLVVGTSLYTGTGSHVYRVTIDGIQPPVNQQTFTPGGNGNLNDGVYNTSSYSAPYNPNNPNIYNIIIVGNLEIIVPTSEVIGTPVIGDTWQGSVTHAEGVIIDIRTSGLNTIYAMKLTTVNSFAENDTLQDLSRPTVTAGMADLIVINQNWYSYLKNGSIISLSGHTINPLPNGLITLTDGLTITFGNYFGHSVGDSFQLLINQGGADTFQWQKDGAIPGINVHIPITGGLQTLELGVQIQFVSETGHTLGDFWDLTANQSITKAWNNFYYTLPERKPGEGYIYNLPANFWTHGVQEENVYVNTAYGYWGYVETTLAANLLSETIRYVPLKQTASAKVIFPYMIGYLENDLSFITENKQLQLIGRKELIELPQIKYLSQPVDLDFQSASFVNGSIEFLNKREYISSPNENIILVYDDQAGNKYWQPPQIIPDLGILSILKNTLISHSSLRNQTINLFTGKKGDNNFAYTFRARTAYNSYGNRWQKKNSNKTFIEGYMSGKPPLISRIYPVINGGGLEHFVKPKFDPIVNRASFGEGSFGSHSFGSDMFNPHPHFNEIYAQYKPILSYYFLAFEAECTAKTHPYSILSMGANGAIGTGGNNQFINQEIISQE